MESKLDGDRGVVDMPKNLSTISEEFEISPALKEFTVINLSRRRQRSLPG